ncbi:hypothetical protein [Chroococcidiopsis cubana]|uniref:hypothetical protein n=1 Tax=Chroococcidiopsis cubana TaxID=171392 RepID=UPI0013152792|nr:hypothetical protein [Chroococcidiopsis cubana]
MAYLDLLLAIPVLGFAPFSLVFVTLSLLDIFTAATVGIISSAKAGGSVSLP